MMMMIVCLNEDLGGWWWDFGVWAIGGVGGMGWSAEKESTVILAFSKIFRCFLGKNDHLLSYKIKNITIM